MGIFLFSTLYVNYRMIYDLLRTSRGSNPEKSIFKFHIAWGYSPGKRYSIISFHKINSNSLAYLGNGFEAPSFGSVFTLIFSTGCLPILE